MNSYAIIAKIPKNANMYLKFFRSKLIDACIHNGWECVIEYLPGRIIVFSSQEPCKDIEGIKGVVSCRKVTVFQQCHFEVLIDKILQMLKMRNCESFAIHSNKKEIEVKIADSILQRKKITVNLENPDCKITVEKRGDYYLLFV